MLMPIREKLYCRGLASLLILISAGLHFAYLAEDCPLELAQDEAHYWDWSRNLDWSYYSKGPLVAWLIRGSCELFGSLSMARTGDLMLAVRIPAILCGSLLLLSLYILTVQIFKSDRFALVVLLMSFTMPALLASSTIMTIDSPYTCCWGWALVVGHYAIHRQKLWPWLILGLLIGVGILAKYTMILFVPSIALFLWTSREHRQKLFRPGFWIMCATGAMCCLPILIWNIQNDWISLKHVGTQAGSHRQSIKWLGPLNFVGGQIAILFGVWFFVWLASMIAHRPWKEENRDLRYLWWLSAPMFLVFFFFSFKTNGGQVNWAITAYLSGLVLAAGWLARQLQSPSKLYRRWLMLNVILVSVISLTLMVFVHKPGWLRPIIEPLAGAPSKSNPFPLRKLDPTCRLRGWRFLAQEVNAIRQELRSQGVDPVLAATRWNIPGTVGVYIPDHPTAYCIGRAMGDRHSQYGLWHPNPVDDPEAFIGRTFIIVGGMNNDGVQAFDEIERIRKIVYREEGQPIAAFHVCICRGFRGFSKISNDRH